MAKAVVDHVRRPGPGSGGRYQHLLDLQATVGNRAVTSALVQVQRQPTALPVQAAPVPYVPPQSVVEMQEMLDDVENLLVDPSFLRPRERQRLYGTTAVGTGWKPDRAGSLQRLDAVLDFVKPFVEKSNIASHARDDLEAKALGLFHTTAWLEQAATAYTEVRTARAAVSAGQPVSAVSDLAVKAKSLLAFRVGEKLKVLAGEGLSFELELGSSPRPAPAYRSDLRSSLPGGDKLDKREVRVLAWLRDNKTIILDAEKSFGVDRRAIAAVIAWEAMKNIMRGGLRGVGPGKMHVYSSKWAGVLPFLPKGHALPQQVEAAGLVPKPNSDEDRERLMTSVAGSVTYIAAAMKGARDIAKKYGYEISHEVTALTSFYQGHDLPSWEEHMKKKKESGAKSFVAADPIAVWAQGHMAYLESILGKPGP